MDGIRVSGEQLLISTLLNLQDVEAASRYGITAAHFQGFAEEYNWLQRFKRQYGKEPTVSAFRSAFSMRVLEHDDVRSAVDLMLERYYAGRLTEAMDRAAMALSGKDIRGAWETLKTAEPIFTTARPHELITDLSFLDTYDQLQDSIEVPPKTLRRITGGIGKGQLWYVGARTNQGKSAHLTDWVVRAIRDGRKVKLYSLEMTEMEVRARAHAILANHYGYKSITSFGILNRTIDPEVYKTFIEEAGQKVTGVMHVHTPADGPVSPGVIANSIADYDLVVVDHIGLMRPDDGGYSTDDWRTAARNSNAIKELALASMTPILAAAQINRQGAFGSTPPDIDKLAGTDALGQDADVVVTMRAMAHDVATSCWTPKNRNGPKARWWTYFNVDTGDFHEISVDYADQLQLEAEDE